MFPILQIGPLAVQVPGLVILLGLWVGLSLSEREAPRFGINANDLYNLAFIALISGVIGARLTYILRYPTAFSDNLLSVISLNPGLLDPWGGAAFGTITAIIYGQRKKMGLWATLDSLTPALAIFMVALGFSHLASGNAFGIPTSLPWGIELWGTQRQPTQIYEIIFAALIFWIIWPKRGLISSRQPGVHFLTFIALSAAARLLLEGFRGDSVLIGGIRSAQVVAWLVLASSLWGLGRLLRKQNAVNEPRKAQEEPQI
jgi:phosphatidylglycerol:prolipoprotein diacylglycerol transferase